MKKTLLFFIGLFFCCNIFSEIPSALVGGNVIKINLSSSIASNHFMMQYEHALGLNRSFGLGIGNSSGIQLPFKSFLLDQFGDNEDAKHAIESTRFDKLTITPEYRFYTSTKGAPLGFYIATFVRYTKLTFKQNYFFTPSNGIDRVAVITGKLNGVGGGAMLGMQWALGNVFTFDWWIVGPFVGIQNGEFNGICNMSDMSQTDLVNLEADIEDTDIPLWKIDATVGSNKINAKISGPFVGVRMFGFCLGYRF